MAVKNKTNMSNKKLWEYILLGIGLFFATGVFWTYMQLTKGYVQKMNQPAMANSINWPKGATANTQESTPTQSDIDKDNSKTTTDASTDITTDIDSIDKAGNDATLNDSQLNDLNNQ